MRKIEVEYPDEPILRENTIVRRKIPMTDHFYGFPHRRTPARFPLPSHIRRCVMDSAHELSRLPDDQIAAMGHRQGT